MRPQLITENVWKAITGAAKGFEGKSLVAVAYFGKDGAFLLPLKEGSKLVVNASEGAVISGQTSPSELIKLYVKGVSIYSYETLHAKVYLFGSKLFIGSANVSNRSSRYLQEVLIMSSDKKTLAEAKKFIVSICLIELGIERLKQLEKLYKPPIIAGGKPLRKKRETVISNDGLPSLHIFRLKAEGYSKGFEEPLKEGTTQAKRKKRKKERHVLNEFEWSGTISAKEGDVAVQVTKENEREFVSPPGNIIHIHKWKNANKWFVFVEVPLKRRKGIETLNNQIDRTALSRSGKKSKIFSQKFMTLWSQ